MLQGEEGEEAESRPAGKAKPARSARPCKVSPETVRLSDIALDDTTFQFRVSPPASELSRLEHQSQREPIDLLGVHPPYRVVDGFRRIATARKLGRDSIKALVHRDMNEKEAMHIAFSRNISRERLSFPEKAHAIGVARRQGLKPAEIAELFGLSERQVCRYLKYLGSPDR